MPSTAGFQKFQFNLYDKVQECALNKTEEEVISWLNKAWDPSVPYAELAKIRSTWSSINRKLISALSPLLAGEFGRSVNEEEQALVKDNKRRLTALQVLHRLSSHLQTNPEMKVVYGLQDLMAVAYPGDKRKPLFRNQWSTKVNKLDKTVDLKVKTAFLLQRLSESTDMATQITLHKSKYRGHESKDETMKEIQERYDDLIGILNDSIKEERLDKNRRAQLASDAKAAGNKDKDEHTPAAPAGKGEKGKGGKGKSKGKDKGKEKGKEGGKDGKGKSKGKEKGKKGEGKGKKGKGDYEKIDVSSLKTNDGGRLCVFFQTGNCQDQNCKYAHEKCTTAEQKTAAQKLRDLITTARAKSQPPAAPATQDGWYPPKPGRCRRGRSSSRGPAQQ